MPLHLRRRPAQPPPATPPTPAPPHDPESVEEALHEVAEAMGEVYKHVRLIESRLGYIEQALVSPGQPAKAVTLVTIPPVEVCAHEAYDETPGGGFRRCNDCGYGWTVES